MKKKNLCLGCDAEDCVGDPKWCVPREQRDHDDEGPHKKSDVDSK